jgi:hypothetical protein
MRRGEVNSNLTAVSRIIGHELTSKESKREYDSFISYF